MTIHLKEHLPAEKVSPLQITLLSSMISSVTLTAVLYPLDLCHTRMSSDMSKKKNLHMDKNSASAHQSKAASTEFGFKQKSEVGRQPKLYRNVWDCVKKSH